MSPGREDHEKKKGANFCYTEPIRPILNEKKMHIQIFNQDQYGRDCFIITIFKSQIKFCSYTVPDSGAQDLNTIFADFCGFFVDLKTT